MTTDSKETTDLQPGVLSTDRVCKLLSREEWYLLFNQVRWMCVQTTREVGGETENAEFVQVTCTRKMPDV